MIADGIWTLFWTFFSEILPLLSPKFTLAKVRQGKYESQAK